MTDDSRCDTTARGFGGAAEGPGLGIAAGSVGVGVTRISGQRTFIRSSNHVWISRSYRWWACID
jgi:hypothetical protein